MSHFVTLTGLNDVFTFFFVSVKGAKGPIGPNGDLGTKGVEVMSPCCVVKMCVKFLYVERQIYEQKVYSLCGVYNKLFCYTGRSWRKRCYRRPGNSRRDGEPLLLTEKKKQLTCLSNVLY